MTPLTLKERWVFSILLPICALLIGYVLVMGTTQGEGSSIGFRAIAALIALPVVVLLTFALNFFIAFPRKTSRLSSFAIGMIVPAIALIVEYAYLWQIWKEYPDIS